MKGLFALLLLINIAILGWGVQRDVDLADRTTRIPPGVGNMRLLSEMPDTKVLTAAVPTQPDSADPPRQQQRQALADPVPPPEPAASAPGVSEQNRGDELYPLLLPPEDPVASAPEAKEALPQPAGSSNLPPPKEQEPESPILVCGELGPFDRGAVGRQVIESLINQGLEASLRRESAQQPVGYWVVIPPFETSRQAIEKVAELRKSGIQDIRRFIRGEQKDGISLGVFSKEDNARKRQQEIARKGHSAQIVPRLITVPVYWIDYRSEQARLQRAYAALKQQNEAIKNNQYPCSRVVTFGGIF